MKLFVALGIGTFLQFYQAAIYTNDWALRINGGVKSATRVAEKYGFTYMGQIGALRNHHIFRHHGMAARSTAPNNAVTVHVAMDTEVEWLQQQAIGKRVRRTFYSCEKNSQSGDPLHRLNQTCLQHLNEYKRRYNLCSDDSEGCRPPMNIAGAWGRGYTGRGVVVSVLDDGLDGEHPDLKPNYDALASFDVNGQERHPSASYSVTAANSHGTRCAGMVAAAMSANQSTCTAGVAFRTRIGGVRMLDVPDGEVTDVAEAQALSFKPQYVDIYLASWGPVDDGATVDGPGPLTRLALKNGIQTGRHGRGSVYVWAAGSGGHRGDHCSCDGYSNSIYTISISSGGGRVLQNQPENQERCASTLAAASAADEISCGPAKWDPALSASAAAGIIALTLEANPLLTWRDLQHIIVQTSDTRQLAASDWQMNGAGHKVSHLYGFGLLDAEGMVLRAKRWRRVPPQSACTVEAPTPLKRILAAGRPLTSVLETSGCSASSRRRRHVAFVEHVVVRVTVACCRRGDLSIALTSPSGTVSQLLDKRPHDNSTEGFHRWEFMTTHCWGERADGEWTLNICDSPSQGRENSHAGRLDEWSLVIYGTARPPYPAQRRPVRSADVPKDADFAEEYTGPCDPECSDDGCDGPGPRQCVTCARYFLKLKNNTRTCVSGCPRGFWGDRRRCKRCYATCESCTGSRSDQCTSCLAGYHLTEGADTCTAVCEEGFFLDHDANMCRKCGERCSRCTSAGVCTECKADSSPRGSRCLPSCAPGMYHDEAEGVCKACHRACAACAGAGVEACTECADGYLTEEWRCVPSCRSGFFATDPEMAHGRWACRRCDASCLTCVGPGRANCSSCSSGHSLQEGECVLRTACTDGEYQDGDGMCHPCHPTCSKCTGPQHLDCVSCGASHALDEGRCLAECPRGKYQSGGQCHLCDHTCATCVEAGPSNCTNCDSDKFGTERYLHKGGCVDACPEAFYRTPERTCEACPHPCTLCTSAAHCLRCNASHYLSDGACVKLECDEGEVEDPDSSDCMACEEGCRQCVLYNPRHCLSCKDGFYNFQDGCYKNCPAKTYSEDEEMSCVPCDGNCVSCDRHECYWCETDLFLAEGKCVSVCPEGFYGDEDTNDCEECHADCTTCRRPGRDGCVSCGDGKTLHDGRCLTEGDVCPVLTFRGGDGECVACHPSCESCSGKDKNQCTKCTKGHFLSPQHTCVSKCPAGSFEDRLSGQCEACPAGCLHCVDLERCTRCLSRPTAPLFLQDGHCVQQCLRGYPAGQACRSCAPGCASCEMNAAYCLSCREPLLLLGHRCVGECPAGHTLHIQECRRCPAACEECSPLGECTACEEYHFLHEGACVPDCPDRFFGDNERRECLRCSADCRSCDGPGRRDCDACEDPRAILLHGECVTPCPAQTFVDDATGECRPCDVSCLTCAGPSADSCSGCREGFGLEGRGGCQPCHKDCRRCSGPGKNRCLSCKHRRLLLDGSCVDECPPSFYGDESRHKCEACHPTCQSCVGKRSRECLACKDGLFRHGNHCVETCPHSHRGNRASGACEPCDPTCGGCSGDGDCLSCAPGLVFMPREGRCLRACPDGFYRRQDGDDATCERCHGNCATCSGKGSHSCESCGPGYRQSGSTCVSVCDTAEYPLIKGSGHSCEDCDASCLRCEGAGPAECSACPPHAILEAGGRCLLCCHVAAATRAEDCCNCTQTTEECVLTTNLAFKNEEEEERGNPVVFIMAGVLLGAGIVAAAAVFLIRHSRSKRAPSDGTQRGYEKLGSGSGSGGCSSPSSRDKGMQMDDLAQHYSVGKDDEDGDDDEEDIVYISRDGTVYRKFRYGETGEDLEYDDESDTYR